VHFLHPNFSTTGVKRLPAAMEPSELLVKAQKAVQACKDVSPAELDAMSERAYEKWKLDYGAAMAVINLETQDRVLRAKTMPDTIMSPQINSNTSQRMSSTAGKPVQEEIVAPAGNIWFTHPEVEVSVRNLLVYFTSLYVHVNNFMQ
jgi:hypothetical protein